MKSKDKLATLCAHKAVAPSWRNLSRQKSYAMKQQPFSIYCEKFRLDLPLSHLRLAPGFPRLPGQTTTHAASRATVPCTIADLSRLPLALHERALWSEISRQVPCGGSVF